VQTPTFAHPASNKDTGLELGWYIYKIDPLEQHKGELHCSKSLLGFTAKLYNNSFDTY
jgi:hypothetical protein